MKNNLILLFCLVSNIGFCQDCIFYDEEQYAGDAWSLNIGESITVHFDNNEEPSWQVLNPNAAIYFEEVNPPGDYPFMRVYSDNSSPFVGGTGQYDDAGDIIVSCITKCEVESCLPQPSTWVPIDRTDENTDNFPPVLPEGANVLVLRKAYLWENSEDIGGIHGPYGSVGLRVFDPTIFEAYGYNDIEIGEDYNEEQGAFANDSEFSLTGNSLPGPIYRAGIIFGPNPTSEWIDGPWGGCYSNMLVYNWTANPNQDEVVVIIREGDDTNPDDYMGGGLVSRDEEGLILVKNSHFGYLVLENITVPVGGEPLISSADYFWNYSWSGNHPEESLSPVGAVFDQYNPLDDVEIEVMESTIPANSTIGLIGGRFPTGVLDKPMIYTAPCEPAVFTND